VARAALDAQEFAVAREVLEPLASTPTKRVAALMAELERKQHGDEGRARAWMVRALRARRDPAWTADGFVSERWLPASPMTGHLDAFEWKDPLAGDEPSGVLIEAEESATPAEPAASAAPQAISAVQPSQGDGGRAEEQASSSQPHEPTEQPRDMERPSRGRTLAPIPVAPAVIPLVHAPDDPGPEAESFNGRGRNGSEEPPTDNWTRIRQLFRH
jgi:HemY protein